MDFSGTFDTTNALSGMYLWLIFGYLSALLNCDLQRFIYQHPVVVHCFGIVAFFFLFTLLDTNNKTTITSIWVKTLFIYILFVLMTKSKWYFVLPVLAALLVDQTLKKAVAIKEASGEDVTRVREQQQQYSHYINLTIILVILVGMAHYAILQREEYGEHFSWYTFFMGMSKCKSLQQPTTASTNPVSGKGTSKRSSPKY
jgi:hypothetical protein